MLPSLAVAHSCELCTGEGCACFRSRPDNSDLASVWLALDVVLSPQCQPDFYVMKGTIKLQPICPQPCVGPRAALRLRHAFQVEMLINAQQQPSAVSHRRPVLLQVVSTPSSSLVWVQYMAHHLAQGELAAARETAERALRTISFRYLPHICRPACGGLAECAATPGHARCIVALRFIWVGDSVTTAPLGSQLAAVSTSAL